MSAEKFAEDVVCDFRREFTDHVYLHIQHCEEWLERRHWAVVIFSAAAERHVV